MGYTDDVIRNPDEQWFSQNIEDRILEMSLPRQVFRAMQEGGSNEYSFDHVTRVAEQATTFDDYVVGICHDVVEDQFATFDMLATWGLTPHQIDAVRLLTRIEGQTYAEYVALLTEAYNTPAGNIAIRVKQFDLYDHLHPDRIKDRSPDSLKRYLDALTRILSIQTVRN